MVFIYVLQCEDNKYYVGKTDTNKFRIDTHFDSNGSEFTKKYKPIEIYQIIPECDKYDEDKYVKKYMDKYGIDNVRGGTYSRIELTTEEKNFIQKELWGANDLCFLCGGEHFVKDCPINKTENVEKNIESDLYIIDEEQLKIIKDRITNTEFPYNNTQNNHNTLIITDDGEWQLGARIGKTLKNRTHICEYFSFDNYTISEYVNNDKEIMDLYKKYVDTYKDCWEIKEESTRERKKRLMLNPNLINKDNKNYIIRRKYLLEIENKIKQLITKLSYIEIDNIINKLYGKNYVLFNFNLNIDFTKIISYLHERLIISSIIYFKYFVEYYKNEYSSDYHNAGNINSFLLFSKKYDCNIHNPMKFQTIADIHITGELVYSADT
jgi:hypothetical protein